MGNAENKMDLSDPVLPQEIGWLLVKEKEHANETVILRVVF